MNTIQHEKINSGLLLNHLMCQTNNIVICLDLDLHITSFNPQAELLFKLKSNKILHKNYFDVCALAKLQPAFAMDLFVTLNKDHIIQAETANTSNKELKCIAWKLSHLVHDSQCMGYLMIGEDISRLKYLEKQVIGKERAVAANQAKSEFLAIMSHELRTPLNAILGMTQILSNMQSLTFEQHEFVQDISIAGNHLLILVNDMLDFAKLEAGKMELKLTNVDIKSMLDEVIDMMAYPAKLKGLKLATQLDKSLPSHLLTDARAFRQILNNLVSNAIKFTDKGQITLTINCISNNNKHAKLELIVADSGIGIPPEKLHLIFDRFQQVDSSYSRRYGGTGLGLAITKQLTELMGGKITVDSELGVGTKFKCVFNFHLKEITDKDLSFEADQYDSRILIVDDSRRGKIMLKQIDCGQPEVVSGLHAFEKIFTAYQNGSPYDIVIIDQKLKGIDAIELAINISNLTGFAETTLILLMEQNSLTTVAQYKQLGFFDCLIKPVQQMELLTSLNAAKKYKSDKKMTTSEHQKIKKENMHVLLVEDNVINQKVSKMMLEELGCVVDIADSGQAVFQLLTQQFYNIILMDIGLPDINGLEITKVIRNKHPHYKNIPIIALTAHAYDSDRQACLSAGMNDVIVKPVMRERLREIIQQWGQIFCT